MLTVGFLAMPNVWPMVYVTLAGLLAIPILWEKMHDYQKNRILAFLDPQRRSDRRTAGTPSSRSSRSAPARSGARATCEGTQNQFDFLPEHWTDFPYSVWAEEWGFVGSVVPARDLRLPARLDPQRRAVARAIASAR